MSLSLAIASFCQDLGGMLPLGWSSAVGGIVFAIAPDRYTDRLIDAGCHTVNNRQKGRQIRIGRDVAKIIDRPA